MYFEQLNDASCKTYLIASTETRDAMLVDPVLEDVNFYLEQVRKHGFELRYVVDTHVHADHISGSPAIRDRTGVNYLMHHRSVSACANVRVGEGDMLTLGEIGIHFLHTPGHTQDSLTLQLPDRILTGDFLFIGAGGAGRTDLPGGDAGEHWDSLLKLSALPDVMLVYPAHDYHGREHSTLGEERANNPRLQPRSRAEYVHWLESQRLGPADWMADVVKANYACAMDPRAAWVPTDEPSCEVKGTAESVNEELVHTISAEGLVSLLGTDSEPILLDVREADEFGGPLGHIAGARFIPVGQLARRLDELANLEFHPIVTICRSGGRSNLAAAVLATSGFTEVHSLDGGMMRWNELRYPLAQPGEPSRLVH